METQVRPPRHRLEPVARYFWNFFSCEDREADTIIFPNTRHPFITLQNRLTIFPAALRRELDADLLLLVPDQAAEADRIVRVEDHVERVGNADRARHAQ